MQRKPLHQPGRHESLVQAEWSEAAALAGVQAIASDAHARYDEARGWPAHPLDEPESPDTRWAMLYFGAGGVIWGLQRLAALGAAESPRDYAPVLPGLVARNRAATESWGHGTGSYLMGDAGLLLLSWLTHRDRDTAQRLMDVVSSNIHHPACEQLWGNPGTMLAAVHMAEATDSGAWRRLFERAVEMLHVQMQHERGLDAWLWKQDLYGKQRWYLGAAHGLAGNLYPVLRGAQLLPPALVDEFRSRSLVALQRTALRDGRLANWMPVHDPSGTLPHLPLLQDCHGAPGVISRLAGMKGGSEWNELLDGAGELVWAAGPLAKGPGLCHGTAGNGWAFLKLYKRTGQDLWLARARAFAMHALDQVARERVRQGRGRYSLWTGDIGVALYAVACIQGDDALPMLDVV